MTCLIRDMTGSCSLVWLKMTVFWCRSCWFENGENLKGFFWCSFFWTVISVVNRRRGGSRKTLGMHCAQIWGHLNSFKNVVHQHRDPEKLVMFVASLDPQIFYEPRSTELWDTWSAGWTTFRAHFFEVLFINGWDVVNKLRWWVKVIWKKIDKFKKVL